MNVNVTQVNDVVRYTARFQYEPAWHADEQQRAPVDIELEVIHPEDIVCRDIVEGDAFYEVELLEHLATRGPLGGVYIDVGANVGNHSVFFGKFLAEHVVAIEPQLSIVPILTRNLACNGVLDYSLIASAVGAEAGLGRLWQPADASINHPRTQVHKIVSEAGHGEVLLPIVPLDDLIEGIEPRLGGRRVTCIKIDVEGMELSVLQGARRLLRRHRPQLVVELVTEEARSTVREFLGRLGYHDIGLRFCWAPTYHFIDPHRHQLRSTNYSPRVDRAAEPVRRITDELCALVPPGQTIILIDDEQMWAGLVMDGRYRLPFLEKDGAYWGPPPDDTTAINELERLRRGGAGYVVLTFNAFWWLEHYPEFAQYLTAHYATVLSNERVLAFDLARLP